MLEPLASGDKSEESRIILPKLIGTSYLGDFQPPSASADTDYALECWESKRKGT